MNNRPNRLPAVIIGLVEFILWVVEIFLILRFVLRLFGANAATPFVQFIYSSTNSLLDPFRGIFPTRVIQPGYVFEFSTLFAIIIYALLAYLVIELIAWVSRAARQ